MNRVNADLSWLLWQIVYCFACLAATSLTPADFGLTEPNNYCSAQLLFTAINGLSAAYGTADSRKHVCILVYLHWAVSLQGVTD